MRIQKEAGVYLASVIEYLVNEVLDLSVIVMDKVERPRPNRYSDRSSTRNKLDYRNSGIRRKIGLRQVEQG